MPDVTPVITATPNVMHAIQNFNITVRITELNAVDTDGLITVRIPKDVRWVFDGPYDDTLTTLNGITKPAARGPGISAIKAYSPGSRLTVK